MQNFSTLSALTALIFSFSIGCSTEEKAPVDIKCGDELAQAKGIPIYSNGTGISSCAEEDTRRHTDKDGYSYGLKWQCVEFVRRYYKDHLNHKMPVQWGNAVDYFRENVRHGEINEERGLIQYRNNSPEKPQVDDIVIFPKMAGGLGHVGIVTEVRDSSIIVAQQNAQPSIASYKLTEKDGIWSVSNDCAGFLRKK